MHAMLRFVHQGAVNTVNFKNLNPESKNAFFGIVGIGCMGTGSIVVPFLDTHPYEEIVSLCRAPPRKNTSVADPEPPPPPRLRRQKKRNALPIKASQAAVYMRTDDSRQRVLKSSEDTGCLFVCVWCILTKKVSLDVILEEEEEEEEPSTEL